MKTHLVLASASPRRRLFLTQLGVSFTAVAPDAEEVDQGFPPHRLVIENARRKVLAGAPLIRRRATVNYLILGVDTIVVLGGHVLGKPSDPTEAHGMITRLSGKKHIVYSGLYLAWDREPDRGVGLHERTSVSFRPLARSTVDWYVGTGEGLDKAGAYGIQELGAMLVERINGCYFNVMGFPVNAFLKALERLGVPIEALRQSRAGAPGSVKRGEVA